MKRADIITILILIGLTASVQLLRLVVPSDSVWAGLSLPQAVAFPIVLIALWRLVILGAGIPRVVLILAAVCALGASGFSFVWRGDRGTDFLLARLKGDPYEAESKILRDRINAQIPSESAVRAVRYYRELETFAESRKALRSNRDVPVVVWGNERWLSLSFAIGDAVARISDFAPAVPFGGEFAIVTRVSRVDISRQPTKPTAAFIAKTLGGLLPERVVNGVRLPSSERGAELALRDGGQIVERWRSFSHRGFAAFALGNFYLLEALASNKLDPATLRCAVSLYRFGRKLFRAEENPELAMAIANNEGVARSLLGVLTGDRTEHGRARSLWRMAEQGPSDLKRLAGAPQARLAAWMNQAAVTTPTQRGKSRRARPRSESEERNF